MRQRVPFKQVEESCESDAYARGQQLANWCIGYLSAERLEAHRAFIQRFWDETPETILTPTSRAYVRAQLDMIHEYLHRGDETP